MRILEEAQRKSQNLISQEEIVRKARVEASEMQDSAVSETTQLRKNTYDYLDELLGAADQKLTELLNDLRLERTELNNHRDV